MYLDGAKQIGFLLAEVEETSNGDSIGQKIDEGDIIDQVVCLSNTQDYYGGGALGENRTAIKIRSPQRVDRFHLWRVLTQTSRAGIGVQFFRWIIANR